MGTWLTDARKFNDPSSKRRQSVEEQRTPTVDNSVWLPRVISYYGLCENEHWSRHLTVDAETGTTGRRPFNIRRRHLTCRDLYGREDADAAFLQRIPFSFLIFSKPGMPDDSLAAMLSTYWGSVHVSPALGLDAGRVDARTAWKLRSGQVVNAGSSTTLLTRILGLNDPVIQERGYVLTGLPR